MKKGTKKAVSVDPGGRWCGVAVWSYHEQKKLAQQTWAVEFNPEQLEYWFREFTRAGGFDLLVFEEWKLFPHLAAQQSGSDMPTSQLIGVLKHLCKYNDYRGPVPWVTQSPKIKRPTRSWVEHQKLPQLSREFQIPRDHTDDAELHGVHFFHRQGYDFLPPAANNLYNLERLPNWPSS